MHFKPEACTTQRVCKLVGLAMICSTFKIDFREVLQIRYDSNCCNFSMLVLHLAFFAIFCFIIAVCALVGCVLMGPRIGRFDRKGQPVSMPGHSVPLSALGGLILVFGFFACNGTKQVSKSLLVSIRLWNF